jgi:hypothetical protein
MMMVQAIPAKGAGIGGKGNWPGKSLPLTIAFLRDSDKEVLVWV